MATEPNPDEKKPDVAPTKEPQGEDTDLVKHLGKEIEARDKLVEDLKKPKPAEEQKPEKKPADQQPDAAAKALEKVEKMEFENTIARLAPHMMENIDDLNKIREKFPSMSPQEVMGYHLGQKLTNPENAEGTQGHRQVPGPGGSGKGADLTKMSDAELFEQGQRELKESGFVR